MCLYNNYTQGTKGKTDTHNVVLIHSLCQLSTQLYIYYTIIISVSTMSEC